MAVRLKIIDKKPARKPWNKKEIKLLINLVKEEKTPSQIVKLGVFSKSRNSIQKKMCSLGFSKKAPSFIKFPPDTLVKFKNFLKDNWERKTPQELTDMWNMQNEIKTNKHKVVYHLTIMNIKIPYAEVARINTLRKKESKIKETGAKSSKQLEELLRLSRAELMRERVQKNRDIWTGLPIKEESLELEEDLC